MVRTAVALLWLFSVFGCSTDPAQRSGKASGTHWLAVGSLLAEFPASYSIYWPDTIFEDAHGWIIRGDSCFMSIGGDGSISRSTLLAQLNTPQNGGAIDTLPGAEFVIAYLWEGSGSAYFFSGLVIPVDTSKFNLRTLMPDSYWCPGKISTCPDRRVSMQVIDSVRAMLRKGVIRSN